MPELVARAIVVERDGVRALAGVDVQVEAGELVAIMGATGSGKSSLALALCGLVPAVSGSVSGDGARAARIVLQRPESTFLADRVLDEVALAALARGEPQAHAHQRAAALLQELGLPADTSERDPLALSGGEQRRVAIAAVCSADPRVLVLDEPGAGLDRAARRELHAVLRALHAQGRTIVLVTHDPEEAARLATRLVVLDAGRIAWDGSVAEVLGSPKRARALGLSVAPEVEVLHRVAEARGVELTRPIARTEDALDALATMLGQAGAGSDGNLTGAARDDGVASAHASRDGQPRAHLAPLPALVDARLRIVACAIAVVAALVASSILAAALVVAAAAATVRASRISRSRVRLATRPLVALAVLLVGLQLIVGGPHLVAVAPGVDTTWPAASAVLRTLQAAAVVLTTLALSAGTAVGDLATGMRRLLTPLALVRVPIGSLAFVVATGLGLVPAFADELERLRLAQRARGIRQEPASLVTRLRLDAALMSPLFVAAFRRAHLLADALAVRGVDPDQHPVDWRPRTVPGTDVAVLLVAVALLVMTRFA